MPLTVADNYDAELRRLNDRFCAAAGIRRTDCVLDIGCGAGQTSRDAARAAVAGKVLGVAQRSLAGERGLDDLDSAGAPTRSQQPNTDQQMSFRIRWSSRTSSRIASGR